MNSKHIILCFVIFVTICSAQQNDRNPSPSIGWDSLKARLNYPVLICRAGIEGAFRVRMFIDSSGNQSNIHVVYLNGTRSEICREDSLLVNIILHAFEDVKWSSKNREYSIPIIFVSQSSLSFHRRSPIINSGEMIILKGEYRMIE
jgi:hypothetical protein